MRTRRARGRTIRPVRRPSSLPSRVGSSLTRGALVLGLTVLGALLTGEAGLVSTARAKAPTNAGGALLLNVEDFGYEYGVLDYCRSLQLTDPAKAVTRLPGDGIPHIVGLYAVFPPDSVGSVLGFSFGIRYSGGARLVTSGPCDAGGMSIAQNGWPASNGGISAAITKERVKTGRAIPLYWFVIVAKSKGSFEVIPHPMANLAGRLVTTEIPYAGEPVVDYGRIDVDQDGYVPQPGPRAILAPCCVDVCCMLTKHECELYQGEFLGYGMTCDNLPCGDDALLGGCCLPSGCVLLTLRDCSRSGGIPLGEKVRCDSIPCPKPEPGSAAPGNSNSSPVTPGR